MTPTPDTLQAVTAFFSSGAMAFAGLTTWRLAKLETDFKEHNRSLNKVKEDVAYMKGKGEK